MEITGEDIKRAEAIFLQTGQNFDEERIKFIKCIDKSLHLQACPGSGKTTTLLAKLFILSEKMPFENNRGICVLTHTNVAINIIKNKLGERANKLLSYPNFFGTIQSFVDRYLAIPAYIEYFGYRPNFIDTSYQKERMLKTYCLSGISKNALNMLRNFHYSKDIFGNYTFSKYNGNFQIVYSNSKMAVKINKPRSKTDWTTEEKKDIERAAFKLKKKVISDGILSFEDAYDFAECYLKKFPDLKNIFSSRFKFVFIDEAQDTSSVQKEIIEKCFNENVIIQWIGDVNQGIMNDNFTESAWNPKGDNRYIKMEFKNSHRVSQTIANIIKNVSINKYNELNGISNIDLNPVLIIFDDSSICKVLGKFAELLVSKKCYLENQERNLLEIAQLTGNPIKAVGWVGKEKDNGLSIKSYFADFDKKLTNIKKQYFPNLYTMYKLSEKVSPREFKDRTLSCILKAFSLSNIKAENGKNFSKTKFLEFIKQKDNTLYNQLMEIICSYYYENNFELFSAGVCEILKLYDYILQEESEIYLTEQILRDVDGNTVNTIENIFTTKIKDEEVKIQIDTVHGVKGETHTATLYLETKYRKNSISYFIDELTGKNTNSNTKENKNINKQALKIAHVAFSRPTHLLCIAIHQNEYKRISSDKNNFEIINLTNNEQ